MRGAAFDGGGARRRSRAGLVVAALAHLLLVAVLLLWRERIVPGPRETVIETAWTLPVPAPRTRPSSMTPQPVARARTTRRIPVPLHESALIALPAMPAIAAAPPASAASAPLPQPSLDLTLSRAQLRALEGSRVTGLAETIAPSVATVSPLARLASDDSALSERRRPDGSIETHVHGTCYVQQRSLANQLDPIGHAHDAALATPCK